MAESVVVSWSGGKDSALALERVVRGGEFRVASLLTTVAEGLERVQIQNVRRELIERQAEALGVPLRCVYIRKGAGNAEYEESLNVALADFREAGVRRVAFGDLFLEDIRVYRERLLARLGMKGLYPLWGFDTRGLFEEFAVSTSSPLRSSAVFVPEPMKLPATIVLRRTIEPALLKTPPPCSPPLSSKSEWLLVIVTFVNLITPLAL